MNIIIHTAKNGFIIYEESQHPHESISSDATMVFETFENMTEYLRKYFGPLVNVIKTPEERHFEEAKRVKDENKQA